MTADRIARERHIEAMVALDTFDALVARVRRLLSYGRRISMTQRYTYTDHAPDLHVGCTVDTEARGGGNNGGKHFGVHLLRPGRLLLGFGFSAYSGDGNDTEKEAWQRYHAGADTTDVWAKRRNMTRLTITGGMDGGYGPARDDLLIIRAWNDSGVCDEKVIGFDTDLYWAARRNEDGDL